MKNVFDWLKKQELLRLLFVLASLFFMVETLWIVKIMVDQNVFHALVMAPITLFVLFCGITIYFNHPMVRRILNAMGRVGLLAIPAYLLFSACFMWLMTVGWDGCVFPSETWKDCGVRLDFVWTVFPMTTPYADIYLWGRGFGGGYEMAYVIATALLTLSLTSALFVTEYQEMTWGSMLLTTGVLLATTECSFYILFTAFKYPESWPGIVISAAALLIFLMLDWWIRKTDSKVDSKEK